MSIFAMAIGFFSACKALSSRIFQQNLESFNKKTPFHILQNCTACISPLSSTRSFLSWRGMIDFDWLIAGNSKGGQLPSGPASSTKAMAAAVRALVALIIATLGDAEAPQEAEESLTHNAASAESALEALRDLERRFQANRVDTPSTDVSHRPNGKDQIANPASSLQSI